MALGVTRTGSKEVLRLWIEQTEGLALAPGDDELQDDWVNDTLIALIDSLIGFPRQTRRVPADADLHLRRALAAFAASAEGQPYPMIAPIGGAGMAERDRSLGITAGRAADLSTSAVLNVSL